MESPGKHISKGYQRQEINAFQEAGDDERRKVGAAEELGDAKWLRSRHGHKAVFVTEEKKGRGRKAARITVRQYRVLSRQASPEP